MYQLYILKCSDGSLYTGITNDLKHRLAMHRSGKGSRYVRAHLPCEVVYTEDFPDRAAASKREQEIKSWDRTHKISRLGITFRQ